MFAHYTMHAKMEASGTPAPLDSKLLRRPLYWEMRPVRSFTYSLQSDVLNATSGNCLLLDTEKPRLFIQNLTSSIPSLQYTSRNQIS